MMQPENRILTFRYDVLPGFLLRFRFDICIGPRDTEAFANEYARLKFIDAPP